MIKILKNYFLHQREKRQPSVTKIKQTKIKCSTKSFFSLTNFLETIVDTLCLENISRKINYLAHDHFLKLLGAFPIVKNTCLQHHDNMNMLTCLLNLNIG